MEDHFHISTITEYHFVNLNQKWFYIEAIMVELHKYQNILKKCYAIILVPQNTCICEMHFSLYMRIFLESNEMAETVAKIQFLEQIWNHVIFILIVQKFLPIRPCKSKRISTEKITRELKHNSPTMCTLLVSFKVHLCYMLWHDSYLIFLRPGSNVASWLLLMSCADLCFYQSWGQWTCQSNISSCHCFLGNKVLLFDWSA